MIRPKHRDEPWNAHGVGAGTGAVPAGEISGISLSKHQQVEMVSLLEKCTQICKDDRIILRNLLKERCEELIALLQKHKRIPDMLILQSSLRKMVGRYKNNKIANTNIMYTNSHLNLNNTINNNSISNKQLQQQLQQQQLLENPTVRLHSHLNLSFESTGTAVRHRSASTSTTSASAAAAGRMPFTRISSNVQLISHQQHQLPQQQQQQQQQQLPQRQNSKGNLRQVSLEKKKSFTPTNQSASSFSQLNGNSKNTFNRRKDYTNLLYNQSLVQHNRNNSSGTQKRSSTGSSFTQDNNQTGTTIPTLQTLQFQPRSPNSHPHSTQSLPNNQFFRKQSPYNNNGHYHQEQHSKQSQLQQQQQQQMAQQQFQLQQMELHARAQMEIQLQQQQQNSQQMQQQMLNQPEEIFHEYDHHNQLSSYDYLMNNSKNTIESDAYYRQQQQPQQLYQQHQQQVEIGDNLQYEQQQQQQEQLEKMQLKEQYIEDSEDRVIPLEEKVKKATIFTMAMHNHQSKPLPWDEVLPAGSVTASKFGSNNNNNIERVSQQWTNRRSNETNNLETSLTTENNDDNEGEQLGGEHYDDEDVQEDRPRMLVNEVNNSSPKQVSTMLDKYDSVFQVIDEEVQAEGVYRAMRDDDAVQDHNLQGQVNIDQHQYEQLRRDNEITPISILPVSSQESKFFLSVKNNNNNQFPQVQSQMQVPIQLNGEESSGENKGSGRKQYFSSGGLVGPSFISSGAKVNPSNLLLLSNNNNNNNNQGFGGESEVNLHRVSPPGGQEKDDTFLSRRQSNQEQTSKNNYSHIEKVAAAFSGVSIQQESENQTHQHSEVQECLINVENNSNSQSEQITAQPHATQVNQTNLKNVVVDSSLFTPSDFIRRMTEGINLVSTSNKTGDYKKYETRTTLTAAATTPISTTPMVSNINTSTPQSQSLFTNWETLFGGQNSSKSTSNVSSVPVVYSQMQSYQQPYQSLHSTNQSLQGYNFEFNKNPVISDNYMVNFEKQSQKSESQLNYDGNTQQKSQERDIFEKKNEAEPMCRVQSNRYLPQLKLSPQNSNGNMDFPDSKEQTEFEQLYVNKNYQYYQQPIIQPLSLPSLQQQQQQYELQQQLPITLEETPTITPNKQTNWQSRGGLSSGYCNNPSEGFFETNVKAQNLQQQQVFEDYNIHNTNYNSEVKNYFNSIPASAVVNAAATTASVLNKQQPLDNPMEMQSNIKGDSSTTRSQNSQVFQPDPSSTPKLNPHRYQTTGFANQYHHYSFFQPEVQDVVSLANPPAPEDCYSERNDYCQDEQETQQDQDQGGYPMINENVNEIYRRNEQSQSQPQIEYFRYSQQQQQQQQLFEFK